MSTALDAVLAAARALPTAGDLRMRQADEVMAAYARLLERSPADPPDLPDEEGLPFAKEAIRHAILTLLEALAEPALREPLRFAYLRLADWQPAHLPGAGIDLANPRTTRDPLAMVSRLADDIAQLVEVAGVVFEAAQEPCHWPQFFGSFAWSVCVREVGRIGPGVEASQPHAAAFFQARTTLTDRRHDGP